MQVWHYTFGHKLGPIYETGGLLPNAPKVAPREKPVLWFSADQAFEPTATKLVQRPGERTLSRLSMQELHDIAGLFRFGISAADPRLVPWSAGLPRRARISGPGVAGMLRAAAEVRAKPTNWFGSFDVIQLDELDFECWTGSDWAPGELEDAVLAVLPKMQQVASASAAAYGTDAIRRAWQAGA